MVTLIERERLAVMSRERLRERYPDCRASAPTPSCLTCSSIQTACCLTTFKNSVQGTLSMPYLASSARAPPALQVEDNASAARAAAPLLRDLSRHGERGSDLVSNALTTIEISSHS